ncbi:MAG: Transcription initiation factor IIB [Candidatus Heimdallarchaeota archaeon LC_3]|nr:MAG: Transcription initiation factor IIB [Candidatus Heimdallarchaeota archaeon LC_3]
MMKTGVTLMKTFEEVNDINSIILPDDTLDSDFCAECTGELIFDNSRGEIICSNCGLVTESKMIDHGQEWRAYSSDEHNNRSRTGEPLDVLSDDIKLRSTFSAINLLTTDAKGNRLSTTKRFDFYRLSKLDNRSRQGEIRNLRIALRELSRITSQLELPNNASKTASSIYRKALRLDLIRGRSIDSMMAASVYIACRETAIPQTLKDIVVATPNLSIKDLARCVRTMIRFMKLKPQYSKYSLYIYRLGEKLQLSMDTRAYAVEIVEKAKNQGILMGKNPMSIAAASLYIAGIQLNERRTQLEFSEASKTTPVTIRNRFKELIEILDLSEIQKKIKRGPAHFKADI